MGEQIRKPEEKDDQPRQVFPDIGGNSEQRGGGLEYRREQDDGHGQRKRYDIRMPFVRFPDGSREYDGQDGKDAGGEYREHSGNERYERERSHVIG